MRIVAADREGCGENMKPAGYTRTIALPFGLLVLLSACSTPSSGPRTPRFTEADAADLIARYYSDDTSYVLKPPMLDGQFRSVCNRASLLNVASQQPQHALAVIVLLHYPAPQTEEAAKAGWVRDLQDLGYRGVVFLRAGNRMDMNGLRILSSPQATATLAGKREGP